MESGNDVTGSSSRPQFNWIEIAVVAGVILLLLSVLLPAVQNARDAARASQSRNNLKQFVLALHNYHDSYCFLPIGGDVEANGTAKHGWMTRSMPYLEASPVYSWIDQDYAWDHPVNFPLFHNNHNTACIPGVSENYTMDGFGLIHYTASPNVFHRNSSVKLKDMTNGAANTWLLGEANGNYVPWAYPFIWRPLKLPFNDGPDSFGRPTRDGVFFGLADGAVKMLSNEVDPAIVEALATAPPLASSGETEVPRVNFDVLALPEMRYENTILEEDDPEWSSKIGFRLSVSVQFDSHDRPMMARFCPSLRSSREPNPDRYVRDLAEQYPDLRILVADGWNVSDESAAILARFTELETAKVGTVSLSRKGREALSSMFHLQTLVGFATPDQALRLRVHLPKRRIHLRPPVVDDNI